MWRRRKSSAFRKIRTFSDRRRHFDQPYKRCNIFFQKERANGKFICSDIFETKFDKHFDLVICHDVIEHIADKQRLLSRVSELLRPGRNGIHRFPCMANAIRRPPADMSQQIYLENALHPFIAGSNLQIHTQNRKRKKPTASLRYWP